jgi:hypothetical protein
VFSVAGPSIAFTLIKIEKQKDDFWLTRRVVKNEFLAKPKQHIFDPKLF